MLSVEEARARILAHARLTDPERVPLLAAAGRVPVSFSVTAAVDVPPFDNSAMDGFALRAADAPGELRLVGEVAAGRACCRDVPPGRDGADHDRRSAAARRRTRSFPLEVAEELGEGRVRRARHDGRGVRAGRRRGHASRRPGRAAGRAALAGERRGPRVARLRRGGGATPTGRRHPLHRRRAGRPPASRSGRGRSTTPTPRRSPRPRSEAGAQPLLRPASAIRRGGDRGVPAPRAPARPTC